MPCDATGDERNGVARTCGNGPGLDVVAGRFLAAALITGGAQGIGRAIARRLGAEGANVVIADIDQEMMGRTCAAMEAEGAQRESRAL